jgi:hypothetical protein
LEVCAQFWLRSIADKGIPEWSCEQASRKYEKYAHADFTAHAHVMENFYPSRRDSWIKALKYVMVNHEHARYCSKTISTFDACIQFILPAAMSIEGE